MGSPNSQIVTPALHAFRFLDLPKELRLMVYEYLLHLHRHDQITVPVKGKNIPVVLVTPCSIPPIQLVCRQVYLEAAAFLKAHFQKIAHLRTAPRLIVPAAHAIQLARYDGFIDEALNWLHYVRCFDRSVKPGFVQEELSHRGLDYGPCTECAAKSLARFANVSSNNVSHYVQHASHERWLRRYENKSFAIQAAFPWPPELREFLRLEHEISQAPVKTPMNLRILLSGGHAVKLDLDVDALLDKLEVRGRDAGIGIHVFWAQRGAVPWGLVGGREKVRRWVRDEGVVSGRSWLEDWA